jgi:histidine triad (HIT) family protein
MIKASLFRLARFRFAGLFIGWIFSNMSWIIPVERLAETPSLIAFHHPAPSYPVHILLVPKRNYAKLSDIAPDDTAFQRDLFVTVAKLVQDLALEQGGYRLICNGGTYQDVPLLHFHLISG